MSLPSKAYRYGGTRGYIFTKAESDGLIPTLDQRSLPKAYVPVNDRCVNFDSGRYFEVIDILTDINLGQETKLKRINDMIDEINIERELGKDHIEMADLIETEIEYQRLQNGDFQNVRTTLGEMNPEYTKYGVMGYVAPMNDKAGDVICVGGAYQYNTALREDKLLLFGIEYLSKGGL